MKPITLLAPILFLLLGACATQPYPIDSCIVDDEQMQGGVAGKAVRIVDHHQEFVVCCSECADDFSKNPKHYHERLSKGGW